MPFPSSCVRANWIAFACCVICVCCPCAASESDEIAFFEAKIRPVLVSKCFACHSSKAEQVGGEFLLDSPSSLARGGESGSAIEPGDPAASLLMEAIRYEGLEMPPSGMLPDRVIADFERWIAKGAVDPRSETTAKTPKTASTIDIPQGRTFWSFQQPQGHASPSVSDTTWSQRKVDTFVLAKIEQAGFAPAPPANPTTLVRRLSFDLTGLPPTPELVSEFQQDQRPDAYRRLVDRLMASPRFGERWARLWLDVARYAEDQAHIVGNNDTLFYPNAYLYRDWLIDAFNHNIPFDRFAKLQLAADLLEPTDQQDWAALGFLGLGPKYYRRNAPEVMADEWEDRVDTVTRGFLGLTVACARCHDHKYDPISTEDYYALAGVFASTQMYNKPLNAEADASEDAEKTTKPADAMHIVREHEQPEDIHVHIRGDALNPGDRVGRRFLQVLSSSPQPLQDGSGRAQLADAIAKAANPLTARVIVNRIWGEYFGQPIVSTPSNFGKLGGRPSHPNLLDDLAVRFVRSGWSLKWLHREIVLSATYQQSSLDAEASYARDPTNILLGRMNQRRLSIEMWRDAMLAATGELEDRVGGESIEVSDPQNRRRSVYAHVSRLELNSMLQMFDFPDPNVHAANRSETITPLQKLFCLNSQFVVAQGEKLAARVRTETSAGPHDDQQRIKRAYELVLSRLPSPEELAVSQQFLQRGGDRWAQFTQALLTSNEMMYID